MSDTAKLIEDLTSLFEAMFSDDEKAMPDDVFNFMAELPRRQSHDGPRRSPETDVNDRIATLAAYLDSGLDEAGSQTFEALLAVSPDELQEAIASVVYLDDVANHRSSAPPDLVDAAIARWKDGHKNIARSADIVSLHGRRGGDVHNTTPNMPPPEVFYLLAAASGGENDGFNLQSPSGDWKVGYFSGISAEDQTAKLGHFLLAVDDEVRATYEGLIFQIYVTAPEGDHIIAEAEVCDGQAYAAVCNFERRHPISVVFRSRPTP